MQRHLYHRMLAAIAASAAVCACDRAVAAPTTQATQTATPGQGFSVSANDANGGHSITSNWKGSFAGADPCTFSIDGLSVSCLYLSVQDGGTPSAPTTFLFYDVYACTFDPVNYWYTCADTDVGEGLIPNSDFSGGGGRMQLRTNTQDDPDFYTYVGSGGLIDVTFRKTNLFTNTQQFTSRYDYGTFSDKENSQGSSASAFATGTVFGTPLSDAEFSTMGTGHGISIYHISH